MRQPCVHAILVHAWLHRDGVRVTLKALHESSTWCCRMVDDMERRVVAGAAAPMIGGG